MAKVYRRLARLIKRNHPDLELELEHINNGLVKLAQRRKEGELDLNAKMSLNAIRDQIRCRHILLRQWNNRRRMLREILTKHHDVLARGEKDTALGSAIVDFVEVYERFGAWRRYYLVWNTQEPESARFFITHSGANGYFDYLMGAPRPPENEGAQWGWYSLENMRNRLTRTII